MSHQDELMEVARRLRCGHMLHRNELATNSRTGAADVPNRQYLVVHMRDDEFEALNCVDTPVAAGLTIVRSLAGVKYAVVRVQRRRLQWRFVVPLWTNEAGTWLENVVECQSVSTCVDLDNRPRTGMLWWRLPVPQPLSLVGRAAHWPALSDGDRLLDMSTVLAALALRRALPSMHELSPVEEVRLVTNCRWLWSYLRKEEPSLEWTAQSLELYCSSVH